MVTTIKAENFSTFETEEVIEITCCLESFPGIIDLLIHMKQNHLNHLQTLKEMIIKTLEDIPYVKIGDIETSLQEFENETNQVNFPEDMMAYDDSRNSSIDFEEEKVFTEPHVVVLPETKHVDVNFYYCAHCPYKASGRRHLIQHFKARHIGKLDPMLTSVNSKPSSVIGNDDDSDDEPLSKLLTSSSPSERQEEMINCFYCNKACSTSTIKAHERQHTHTVPCVICNKTFTSNFCMQKHMKSAHPKHAIPITSRGRGRKPKPKPEALTCSLCELTFGTDEQIKSHLKDHGANNGKWPCDQCAFESNYKDKFDEHIAEYHTVTPHTMHCNHCALSFATKYEFLNHCKTSHSEMDFQIPEFIAPNRVKCLYCDKMYNKNLLAAHERLHQDPIQCTVCLKNFTRRISLKRHMQNVHPDTPMPDLKSMGGAEKFTFTCEHCGAGYETKAQLRNHMKTHQLSDDTKDTPVLRHTCGDCQKSFVDEKGLKHHRIVHAQESHICQHCGQIYGHLKALSRHIYFQHKQKEKHGSKNHVCQDCGAAFNSEYQMNAHRGNVHGVGEINFKCEHCGKGFFRKTEYRVHLRRHSDIRPFICDICGKTFKTKNVLNLHHDDVHCSTGEKNTRCLLCSMMFKNMRHVGSHIRKVHKLSLAQAHEVVGLPYQARQVWNSVSRRGVLTINKRVYKADVTQFRSAVNGEDDE